MKKSICLFLILLIASFCFAGKIDIKYTNGSTQSIDVGDQLNSQVQGKKDIAEIVIGDGVNFIAQEAFKNCSALTKIVFGKGITEIPESTHYYSYLFGMNGCPSLKEVVFSDSLESIGSYAFYKCSSLKEIVIPKSVVFIGNSAFANCNSLKRMVFEDGFETITSSDYYYSQLFGMNGCPSLEEVVLPDSLMSIGDYAFYKCSRLETITIPGNVSYIGNSAFGNCTLLKEMIFSEGFEYIQDSDYYYSRLFGMNGCPSLQKVVLPDTLKSIGAYAFHGCSGLEEVVIPGSVTYFGSSCFGNCYSLRKMVFKEGITEIQDSDYYYSRLFGMNGNATLTDVSFPSTLKRIGSYAFSGCSSLKNVSIGKDVIVDKTAFRNTQVIL